jgi:hypothetical protein
MLNKKLLGSVSAGPAEYVEDVFSTYLYTGNGSTQTITNNVDLAGDGGLVWIKRRDSAVNHYLATTDGGTSNYLNSNTTSDYETGVTTRITSFNADGFSLGSAGSVNNNTSTFCSWTFRKAEKFFDVVTYTGNGNSSRTVNHNLGSAPGIMIVKKTSGTGNWIVYSDVSGTAKNLRLNTTGAAESDNWLTYPTSTNFTVFLDSGTGAPDSLNDSGATYVAYLFADDAGGFGTAGTDNIITCGSYTGNGSATGPTVTLNYEPQYILIKGDITAGNWLVFDNMRGIPTGGDDPYLLPNSSAAEATGLSNAVDLTSTGFQIKSTSGQVNNNGTNYIYMAIRRPMKVPTTGTEVFNAITRTGTGSNATVTGAGFAPDAVAIFERSQSSSNQGTVWFDRSRGVYRLISSHTTSAETDNDKTLTAFNMNGFSLGTDSSVWGTNQSGADYINYVFKRASKFFDIVCYAGTGSTRTVTHNLGVVPELIITADRSVGSGWAVYTAETGNTKFMELSETATPQTSSGAWDNTSPTSSVFTVKNLGSTNASGRNYFAYLFATLAGISKVGSYTGNGSSQTINCGFSGGARFVLIKRTSASGDWYVWDTVRGIVSGNDPHLSLDSNVAEVTTDDSIDPDNSGFIVNQLSATNINVSSATYIFLAIA